MEGTGAWPRFDWSRGIPEWGKNQKGANRNRVYVSRGEEDIAGMLATPLNDE